MNYKSKKSAWQNLNVLEVALFTMFNFPTPENRLAVERALEHLSLHKDAQQLTARQALSQWIPTPQKKPGGMVLSVARLPLVATRTVLRPVVSHKPEILAALAAAALFYDYKYNRFEITGDILSIGTERLVASTVGRLGWTAVESGRMAVARTALYIEKGRSSDTALVPTVDVFDSKLWTVGPFDALLPSATAITLDIVTLLVWVSYDHWRLPKGGTVNIPSVANEFGALWKRDRGFRNKPVQFSPETFVLRVALVYSLNVALQALRNLDLYDWKRAEKVNLAYAGAQFSMNAIQVFWALTSGYLIRKWYKQLYPNPSANKQLLQTATRAIEERVPNLSNQDLARVQATAARRQTAEDDLEQQNSVVNLARTVFEATLNRQPTRTQQPQPQRWVPSPAFVYEATQRVTVTPMFAPLQLQSQTIPFPNTITNNAVVEEGETFTFEDMAINSTNRNAARTRSSTNYNLAETTAFPSELFADEWQDVVGTDFDLEAVDFDQAKRDSEAFAPTHRIDLPTGRALYEWLVWEFYKAGSQAAVVERALRNQTIPDRFVDVDNPPLLEDLSTGEPGAETIRPEYNKYATWLLALGAADVQLIRFE